MAARDQIWPPVEDRVRVLAAFQPRAASWQIVNPRCPDGRRWRCR
jgi:hypothetical protein